MKTALGTILITEQEIRRRIAELGRQISNDYLKTPVTLVGILRGSFVFLADLIRAISLETQVEVQPPDRLPGIQDTKQVCRRLRSGLCAALSQSSRYSCFR